MIINMSEKIILLKIKIGYMLSNSLYLKINKKKYGK